MLRKTAMLIVIIGLARCCMGCSSQLDRDFLALTQEHAKAFDVVVTFSQTQRQIIKERINATFVAAEQQIADRDAKIVLDPRTVKDDDGVERMMTKDKTGKVRAWSRAELDAYVSATVKARKDLMQKRMEWDSIDAKWGELLAKAKEVNTRQLKTAADLTEAKASAQALAEQAASVLGSLTAGIVSGYALGL